MENKICVSVIVPVYQVEKYLERCIVSLLNQTYTNLEILLIDDGSRDSSGEICDQYAKKDSRIRVFHKANGGLSDARNYGIERSRGAYLAFVDSDDYVKKDYIECLLKACLEQKCSISVCGFESVASDFFEEEIPCSVKWLSSRECMEAICDNGGDHVLMTVAWNKLYKRELFEEISYPAGKLHEDEATTYKLLHKAGGAAVCSKKLYGYFMSPDSIMRRQYNKKRLVIVEIQLERIRFFHENGMSEMERKGKRQLTDTIIYHYYNVRKFVPESTELQKKLLKCFGEYCIKDVQCSEFPLAIRLHNKFFYYFTGVYYALFCLYQKMKRG